MIHATALIDAQARIGANVSIGAYSVIGPGVEVGDDCDIGSHVVINGPTIIGPRNRFHSFSSIGGDPQDKKFRGESARLEIGADNMFREFVTLNRGTADGGGVTRIGDRNWIMAYVHVAHDCLVGNDCIFANASSLAGHVRVDDFVILGGFTLMHQFCQIGAHAFTAMGSVINRDVPPYTVVAGSYAEPKGINSEGLKRRGFSSESIMSIKRAYRMLYLSGMSLAEARVEIARAAEATDELRILSEFIDRSERSLIR